MKQLTQDPWEEIDRYFRVGDVVKGKVSKITNYGAFVELANDIDGLVHISQINEDRVEKIKDVLKIGQDVTARVIKVDHNDRRIGLSIKAATYDASQLAAEVAAFDRIKGDQEMTSLGDILDEVSLRLLCLQKGRPSGRPFFVEQNIGELRT
jgi:small subunit ribosomal protein S1